MDEPFVEPFVNIEMPMDSVTVPDVCKKGKRDRKDIDINVYT